MLKILKTIPKERREIQRPQVTWCDAPPSGPFPNERAWDSESLSTLERPGLAVSAEQRNREAWHRHPSQEARGRSSRALFGVALRENVLRTVIVVRRRAIAQKAEAVSEAATPRTAHEKLHSRKASSEPFIYTTMSEEDGDGDILGPDGQVTARVDRDRRAPRFSWTPAYEATFFRSLCESVQLGLRENSSFKAEAWERAAQALQESHGAYPTKNHLINKSDNARKRFRLWRGLRENPDFLYNPVTRTVTATEDAWRAHIEREPLSRALRGRPFDHEDYMEILYPDVVGSGGAPKRIMKPRRRTDGPLTDDTEMPGTGILNLQSEPLAPRPSGLESPTQHRPSISQTPTTSSSGSLTQQRPISTTLPSRAPTSSTSALTPPDETVPQTRKRQLPPTGTSAAFNSTPPSVAIPLNQQMPASPEKRRRTSSNDSTRPSRSMTATLNSSALPITMSDMHSTGALSPQTETQASAQTPVLEELLDVFKSQSRATPQWREEALEVFFRDFADEDLDLQVKISEDVLCNESKAIMFCKMPVRVRQHWVKKFRDKHVSYADVAASGPKQTPEEVANPIFLLFQAAAPQPIEIEPTETASTASLVDVDMPSVHTVSSDFLEQDVQTTTQADRLDREETARTEKAKVEQAKKDVAAKAKKADSWLTRQVAGLSDGSASAVVIANLVGVVGLSSYLGYKAWGLYEKGRLSWQAVGLGVGILASVGAVEAVFGRYLYKGKKNN
ncbi:hypothetical protein G7046_g10015 [Stylonectria norvegica]|nr:hypothetical protein G7046_g10015 [Stylonectria norvegica]